MHQRRLLATLFKNYDPAERPVENEEDSLMVAVGLSVQQIVDIVIQLRSLVYSYVKFLFSIFLNYFLFCYKDERKQTIFFSGWLDIVSHQSVD